MFNKAIKANPNCFVFNELFPGGFTPSFGGDVSDWSLISGIRGVTASGLTWDVSASVGENVAEYFIMNTVNASLGPDTPTEFYPGDYVQLEKNFNCSKKDLQQIYWYDYAQEIMGRGAPIKGAVPTMRQLIDTLPRSK